MFALIQNGLVWDLFAEDPMLPADLDVRDVSTVKDIARGWIAQADGSFIGAPPVVTTAAQLTAHADRLLSAAIAAGIDGDVGAPGSPLVISADTTAEGKANVLGLLAAYTSGLKRATDTTTWYQSSGTIELTQGQLLLIAQGVLRHSDAAYAAWHAAVVGITAAAPTITTFAEVDAAFEADARLGGVTT